MFMSANDCPIDLPRGRNWAYIKCSIFKMLTTRIAFGTVANATWGPNYERLNMDILDLTVYEGFFVC